jgi:hypothetical protein
MSVPSTDPRTPESRVGQEAIDALARGARVRSLVTLLWLVGLPIVAGIVLAIPPIRIYILFFVAGYWLIGMIGFVLAVRYLIRQQRIAVILATRHLGIGPRGPFIPVGVIRDGSDYIDAWLAGHGVVNPVTGLDPTLPVGQSPPGVPDKFVDRKGVTNFGIGLMFFGVALLVPWAIIILRASITDVPSSPLVYLFLVGAFGCIAGGVVVVAVSGRRRVRARVAWVQARQRQQS